MGGYLSQPVQVVGTRRLLKYRKAVIEDIDECTQIMVNQMNRPLAVNREELQQLLGLYLVNTEEHFELWKGPHEEVDVLRVFCGAYLHCDCPFEQKIHGIFDLFGTEEKSGMLGWDDISIVLMSCHRGLSVLAGLEVEEQRVIVAVDKVLERAFKDLTAGDPKKAMISSYDFHSWVTGHRPLMMYYKNFLEKDITTMLTQTKSTLHLVEETYDELVTLHGTLESEHLVNLFTSYVEGMSNSDVTDLMDFFDTPENREKDALVRGIRVCLAYDAIDCHGMKRLKAKDFGKLLIWMVDGIEPPYGRVEYVMNSLLKFHKRTGTMATSKHETVSRQQWRQFMLDEEVMTHFQKQVFKCTLHECYILTDQQRRKRLYKAECAQMVQAAIITHVKHSITAPHHMAVLQSVSVQVVNELWENVSPPVRPQDALPWTIIEKYLTLLYAKTIDVVQWFHLFTQSRYSDIFNFLPDGSSVVDIGQLPAKLRPLMGEMVVQGLMSEDDAQILIDITVANIITRLDLKRDNKSDSTLTYQQLLAIEFMEEGLANELQDHKDNHRQEAKLSVHMANMLKTPHLSRINSLDNLTLNANGADTMDFYDDLKLPLAKVSMDSIAAPS